MKLTPQSVHFYLYAFTLNILVVIIFIGSGSGWWIKNPGVMISMTPASVLAAKRQALYTGGKPVSLYLPEIDLSHKVLEGSYNSKDSSWTLNETDTFFANLSAEVNNTLGTTLIYGHNTRPVFGRLTQLTEGSELIITVENGDKFYYKFLAKQDLEPTDTSVFQLSLQPRVMLQTCSGNWNELRTMYEFKFVKLERVKL